MYISMRPQRFETDLSQKFLEVSSECSDIHRCHWAGEEGLRNKQISRGRKRNRYMVSQQMDVKKICFPVFCLHMRCVDMRRFAVSGKQEDERKQDTSLEASHLGGSLELVLERETTEPEREMDGPGESQPER